MSAPQHIIDRLAAKAEAKRARKRRERLTWREFERIRVRVEARGYYTAEDVRDAYALLHTEPTP
jgi:hypothetical protein